MSDILKIAGIAASGAVAIGVSGLAALRVLRGRSLRAALFTITLAAVLAMIATNVAAAYAMFVSPDDVAALLIICAAAGITTLGMATLLGRKVAADSETLRSALRTLGSDPGRAPGQEGADAQPATLATAEMAKLRYELIATNKRLGESRQRERALERSRRELVAWVSHDLRTPLAGLRAMAEALEDGIAANPGRYYTQMRAAVDRLTTMVGDLFELSRIHAGALRLSLQEVRLADLVDDVVAAAQPLAQARRVKLEADIRAPAAACADAREISRALTNLVVNAIRHTPGAGTVRIEAGHYDGHAVLTVTDACGGIPEEHLARVFDVAWRASEARTPGPYAGAGLGLAIVRGIVEAHSGQVDVRNITGGCRFEVKLPVFAR
jgi:signal transduction histidine kinase